MCERSMTETEREDEPEIGDMKTDMRIVEDTMTELDEHGLTADKETMAEAQAVLESLIAEADVMDDADEDALEFLEDAVEALSNIESNDATQDDVEFAQDAMSVVAKQMVTVFVQQSLDGI